MPPPSGSTPVWGWMKGQARRFHPTSTIFSPIIPHLLADPERAGDQAALSGIHPLSLQDEGGHFLILPASFVKVPAPDTKKFYDLPHAFLHALFIHCYRDERSSPEHERKKSLCNRK